MTDITMVFRHQGEVLVRHASKHAVLAPWLEDFFCDPESILSGWRAFPDQDLAPICYGLMVVDFDGKWMVDSQVFANPLEMSAQETGRNLGYVRNAICKEGAGVLVRCQSPGGVGYFPGPIKGKPRTNLQAKNLVQAAVEATSRCAQEAGHSPWDHGHQVERVMPAGWTATRFAKESAGDWGLFLDALLERGFCVGRRQLEQWDAFLAKSDMDPGPIRAALVSMDLDARLGRATPGGGKRRL